MVVLKLFFFLTCFLRHSTSNLLNISPLARYSIGALKTKHKLDIVIQFNHNLLSTQVLGVVLNVGNEEIRTLLLQMLSYQQVSGDRVALNE